MTATNASQKPQLDTEELLRNLRRENLRTMYQQHLQFCWECRTHRILCDVGWTLSQQLLAS